LNASGHTTQLSPFFHSLSKYQKEINHTVQIQDYQNLGHYVVLRVMWLRKKEGGLTAGGNSAMVARKSHMTP
jgi:hypothetical protein